MPAIFNEFQWMNTICRMTFMDSTDNQTRGDQEKNRKLQHQEMVIQKSTMLSEVRVEPPFGPTQKNSFSTAT